MKRAKSNEESSIYLSKNIPKQSPPYEYTSFLTFSFLVLLFDFFIVKVRTGTFTAGVTAFFVQETFKTKYLSFFLFQQLSFGDSALAIKLL